MIKFQSERFADILGEMRPLIDRHFMEIEGGRLQRFRLSRDFGKYISMEHAGWLGMVTARYEDDLVGYCLFMIMPHPRFDNCLFALNDAIYLLPEHRRGWTAARMIAYAEDYLAALGVDRVMISVPVVNDFSAILGRRGFEEVERNFEKQFNRRA